MRKQTITEIWARSQCGFLCASYVCCFWGNQCEFDRLVQAYAIERTRLEARKQGHTVLETPLADGAVKLTIEIGGAHETH